MYARMLVPLDGSILAEQVLPYVSCIGKGLSARVDLLRVFEPADERLIDPAKRLYLDRLSAALRDQAGDYLARVAAPLQQEGLTVAWTTREGNPAEYIVREAENDPGTIIAMATHGRSGVGRWLLGSVADKVLHAASAPLLLIRPREPPLLEAQLDSVIVPLDGSPLAEQALPHAVRLAQALSLKVLLVRVAPTLTELYEYSVYFGSRSSSISEEVKADALDYIRQVAHRVGQQHTLTIEERLLRDSPAGAIVGLARDTPNSLVMVTTHGRSGIGRWVLGSVTDRVVRHSGGPVLVIRAVREPPESP